jgi:RNA polymerase sigma factor (sigma-70 family)
MSRPTPTADREPAAPAHEEVSDSDAIRLSLENPEEFALLFRRHAAGLYRYAARRLGAHVAEDVVADLFLHAFRQRHLYEADRKDARPWLYGIATNVISRHRRTEIRLLRKHERTGVDLVTEGFAERSDARLGAEAVRRQLAAALAGLRPGYRDALLLVAWGELTYEEVAAALCVPVGTVRSRISRARRDMKAALGGSDPTSLREDHDG